jgi:hypothetical protein
MAVKKEVIVLSVVYRDDDTPSIKNEIDQKLFNTDGAMEWSMRTKSLEELSASITEEDME